MMDTSKWRIELDQFDLLAMGSIFRVCDMATVLLGRGQSRVVLGSAFIDGAVLYGGEYAFPFRGRFKLPPDWCMLAYVHSTPPGSWCHGNDLAPGTAMILMPGGGGELMLKAGSCWSAALIPVARLRRVLGDLTACATEMAIQRLVMFDTHRNDFGEELQECFGRLRRYIDLADAPPIDIDGLLRAHLRAGLLSLRPAYTRITRITRARRAHYQVLRRVEDFMFGNLRSEITNRQLCRTASASERTLRYAFNGLLGVSPNRYLSLLRLCEANRSLAMADARRRTVKSVALSCGLWNLSRFAENYRNLFGELPNQTLARQERILMPHDDRRMAGQVL